MQALRDDPVAAVLAVAREGRLGKRILGISRQEQVAVESAAKSLLQQGAITPTQLVEVQSFLFHRVLPRQPPSPLERLAAILQRNLDGRRKIEATPSTPTDEDAALVGTWSGDSDVIDLKTLANVLPTSRTYKEVVRCLSARLAERFAVEVFRKAGKKVVDISATQLKPHAPDDWRSFDLLVDGSPIDVKNARSSYRNKDRYVEHCVPRLKRHRSGDVAIAGVLSPYVGHLSGLLSKSTNREPLVYLGSVTQALLRDLEQWFSVPNVLNIDLGREGSAAHFLPSWLFTSKEHEASVATCAEEVRPHKFPSLEEIGDEAIHWLMPSLLFKAVPTLSWISKTRSTTEQRFAKELVEATELFGPTLPAIFLTVLRHFLTAVASGELWQSHFSPLSYRKFLFFGGVEERPLGAYDPLRTTASLVTALSKITVDAKDYISEFRSFRLVRANILQGRPGSGSAWTTVIAYCGGWDEVHNVKCGTNPLVIEHSRSNAWFRGTMRRVSSLTLP